MISAVLRIDYWLVAQVEITQAEPEPGRRVLAVSGEFDLAVADRLQLAFEEAGESLELHLDLSECKFIDSTVIALFVRTREKRAEEGRGFVLLGAEGQVLRVLELTGLAENGLVPDAG